MNERIKELAEQAGLIETNNGEWYPLSFGMENIKLFAELARQDEREACAKLCDIEASVQLVNVNEAYQHGKEMGATVCAEAIRQRGKE